MGRAGDGSSPRPTLHCTSGQRSLTPIRPPNREGGPPWGPMAGQGNTGPSPLLELPLPGRPRGSATARAGTGVSPSDNGMFSLPSVLSPLLYGSIFWPLAT